MTRPFDVVVFGATGFTGGLVCEYLATHAPDEASWAIAGRNAEKLAHVRDEIEAHHPGRGPKALLHADAGDASTLHSVASQARVVLTTVGPYARFGEPLVAACVAEGTDYVDITGEPQFVDRMIIAYHEQAQDKGLRIVNCCGFDSIPHDLGALFTVRQLPSDQAIQLRGFVQAKGMFSGGTWHSAINAMAEMRQHSRWRREQDWPRAQGRKVRVEKPRVYYEPELRAWAAPLATIDPDIVRRSAQMITDYGPDFQYGHYARVRKLHTVVGAGIGLGGLVAGAQFGPTRKLLLKVASPGEGPPAEKRARNWFTVRFIGNAADGSKAICQVSGGDPGYDETAKMVSESALCLAFDRERLPAHAGVITPAAAMGEALIQRLVRRGISFEVIEGPAPSVRPQQAQARDAASPST